MMSLNHPTPSKRVANRPPLRTTAEIAEILGMRLMVLVRVLALDGAPKPRMDLTVRNRGGRGRAANPTKHYEPKEVVAWVRAWQEKKGGGV
jgi:hypothetical protein